MNTGGSGVPSRTGNTNICSGMSAWKRADSMKSTSLRAAAACSVPCEHTGELDLAEARSSIVPIGDVVGWGFEK